MSARPEFTPERAAPFFAALGDPVRLGLLLRLAGGAAHSIVQLTEDTELTRQGVTKHLAVMERAGIVTRRKSGRESLYALRPEALGEARDYLDRAGRQWDEAMARLARLVED